MYQVTQSNSPNQVSSFLSNLFSKIPEFKQKNPENTSSYTDIKVIYRTQEEIEKIQSIRYPLLQHPTTGRRSAIGCLLKLIVGRELKLGNCITKQSTLAREIYGYGYDKLLNVRQIKRLIKKMGDLGLLSYKRSKSFRSAYRYESTSLGRDLYFYVIQNNEGQLRLKTIELSQESNVKKEEKVQMSPREVEKQVENTPESVGFELNVTSNMDIPDLRNIHMGNNTSERFTGKIDLSAKPIDLDEPPREILFAESWHISTGDADGFLSNLQLGRANYQNTESNPTHISNKKESMPENNTGLSRNVFIKICRNFSEEEQKAITTVLKELNCGDDIKINVINSVKNLVATILKAGNRVHSFELLAKSIVKNELKKAANKNLSTISVNNSCIKLNEGTLNAENTQRLGGKWIT